VLPRYPPAIGGSETWCAGLARWQRAQGHDVRVLTLRAVQDDELWGDGPVEPTSIAVGASDVRAGVQVRRCPSRRAGPGATWLLGRLHVPSLAYGHSPVLYGLLFREARGATLVHAHTVPGPHLYIAYLATRVAGRPFVLTPHFHAGEPVHQKAPLRGLFRRADHLVVLTRFEAELLGGNGASPARISPVSNAVDLTSHVHRPSARARVRTALGVPPAAPLVAFVGRKTREKGLDVLLRALTMARHRPAPVLALAGPGTAWYRGLLAAGPTGSVLDLPLLSERAKAELLAASDLLVLPSPSEAFGTVFLEAWASGTPVLGADVPAVVEVLGDAGATFSHGDARDLARAIDAVLDEPEKARAQAARGRERLLTAHTWDHVGPAVITAYRHACARGRRDTSVGNAHAREEANP